MKANMNLYITRTITDTKTGKVIKQHRKKQCKSFVKAFMQCLELLMGHEKGENSDDITIKDTANAPQTATWRTDNADDHGGVEAPANIDTYGIQIGTGTTAPTVSDYTIETQIAHGAGAGQMQYGAGSVQSATVSGAKMEMTITRAFVNASGGSITVKEVTLVTTWQPFFYNFLWLRDAVDDAVGDGQTYTVTLTLETTV